MDNNSRKMKCAPAPKQSKTAGKLTDDKGAGQLEVSQQPKHRLSLEIKVELEKRRRHQLIKKANLLMAEVKKKEDKLKDCNKLINQLKRDRKSKETEEQHIRQLEISREKVRGLVEEARRHQIRSESTSKNLKPGLVHLEMVQKQNEHQLVAVERGSEKTKKQLQCALLDAKETESEEVQNETAVEPESHFPEDREKKRFSEKLVSSTLYQLEKKGQQLCICPEKTPSPVAQQSNISVPDEGPLVKETEEVLKNLGIDERRVSTLLEEMNIKEARNNNIQVNPLPDTTESSDSEEEMHCPTHEEVKRNSMRLAEEHQKMTSNLRIKTRMQPL